MEKFKSSNSKEELVCDNLDANSTDSFTDSIEITDQTTFSLYVDPVSGTNATHQIILQSSADDENFYDNGALVTGLGCADDDKMVTNYVRAKVKVAEGAASTVCVTIIAQ